MNKNNLNNGSKSVTVNFNRLELKKIKKAVQKKFQSLIWTQPENWQIQL